MVSGSKKNTLTVFSNLKTASRKSEYPGSGIGPAICTRKGKIIRVLLTQKALVKPAQPIPLFT